ncbi:MAG: type IV pili twitching motility protein PilT [Deltaproteobacteria bacterium]|nr:MAG: type IV pili twitching motility protein PilT [Deltaproteobacteria bacterium]
MDILELLKLTVEKGASDLHLTVNSPPMLRIHGELLPACGQKLTSEDTKRLIISILSQRQKEVLQERGSIDFAYSLNGQGFQSRFRVNAYYQQGQVAAAFRRLSNDILTLEELNLPNRLYDLCNIRDGLILVTGATGSGKSTTLAALIDRINETRACHIITIEDPIEYVHKHKKGIVNQRELHSDVFSFSDGLRSALREDPDVILVGEMRDLETIRIALMAAETGHLVFSTLHTRNAISTIGRIIGVFPEQEQAQISHQLSLSLRVVISQMLLRRADGSGRVPAIEIMTVTPAISNLIRLRKDEQIRSIIETGAKESMQTMDSSLMELYKKGYITKETLIRNASSQKGFERMLKQEDKNVTREGHI